MLRILTCGMLLWAQLSNPLVGDVSVRERAIDVVLLADGTRLLGVVMPGSNDKSEAGERVTLLLRADWLKQNAAELYAEAMAAEEDAQPKVTVQALLQGHIKELQGRSEPDVQRITFLTEELNAMQPKEESDEPDVLLLKIPENRVKRQMLKNAGVRRLAGLGILNRVDTTETARVSDLRKVLQKIPAAELIQDVPGEQGIPADVVFHRVLLHADRTIGKTSRLVFFNGTWLSEASAAENQEAMLLQMMTGGLKSQLQQLLNETAGPLPENQPQRKRFPDVLPANAQALVDAEEADVVEVRTMQLNPGSGTASVGMAVYWRQDDAGSWTKIEAVHASANQSDVSAESRHRILQDKRVQEVTELFSQLGVNSSQLNSALTMGAIVESASGRAEQLLSKQLQPRSSAGVQLRLLRRTLQPADDK